METPDNFEARITAALEGRSEAQVPAEFAARVLQALPAKPPRVRAVHLGRSFSAVLCLLLLLAMILVAPHASASFTNRAFEAELCLTAMLGAIASWLGLKWRQV